MPADASQMHSSCSTSGPQESVFFHTTATADPSAPSTPANLHSPSAAFTADLNVSLKSVRALSSTGSNVTKSKWGVFGLSAASRSSEEHSGVTVQTPSWIPGSTSDGAAATAAVAFGEPSSVGAVSFWGPSCCCEPPECAVSSGALAASRCGGGLLAGCLGVSCLGVIGKGIRGKGAWLRDLANAPAADALLQELFTALRPLSPSPLPRRDFTALRPLSPSPLPRRARGRPRLTLRLRLRLRLVHSASHCRLRLRRADFCLLRRPCVPLPRRRRLEVSRRRRRVAPLRCRRVPPLRRRQRFRSCVLRPDLPLPRRRRWRLRLLLSSEPLLLSSERLLLSSEPLLWYAARLEHLPD